MSLRYWSNGEFASDVARHEHYCRAVEQWNAALRLHFWLLGEPGREGTYRGRPMTRRFDGQIDEVARAETELRERGWSLETLDDAANFARANPRRFRAPHYEPPQPKTSKKKRGFFEPPEVPFGGWEPPPTIERDFAPEPSTEGSRSAWMARIRETLGGPYTPLRQPIREVLFAGNADGTERELVPVVESDADRWHNG